MKTLLNAYFKGGTSTGGPLDLNGSANTGTAFDTSVLGGVGDAVCVVQFGNIVNDTTVLKIEESDDNSNWSDVTNGGFTSGATGTLPLGASADNKQWLFHVTTGNGRKRYLRVSCTPGAGATLYSALWIGLNPAKGVGGSTEAARSIAANLGGGTYSGRIVL